MLQLHVFVIAIYIAIALTMKSRLALTVIHLYFHSKTQITATTSILHSSLIDLFFCHGVLERDSDLSRSHEQHYWMQMFVVRILPFWTI